MGFSETNGIVVPERKLCSIGELIAGKYRVESSLGTGAFGHVYKVCDSAGVRYALKVLHLWDVPSDIRQPLIDRFKMEFMTGQIQNEYLVHSIDSGYISGNPFILMEFCPGGDLGRKLGKSSFKETVRISEQILAGLHALHSNGKVHRDLKPENVLFKSNGSAALTDFGISGDRNKRMTERNIFGRPYQIFGTYAYMPPEQVNRARGGSTVLPTTDIFSFGVLLYQLITGWLPFGTLENQNDLVIYQKRGKNAEWDRDLLLSVPQGRAWEKLIRKCLEPDFRMRIQNAGAAMKLIPYGGRDALPLQPAVNCTPFVPCSRRYVLKILQGQQYNDEFDVTELMKESGKDLVTVGRDTGNSIVISEYNSFYMSRKHFTMEYDRYKDVWKIRDGQWNSETGQWQRSSNGTYVHSSEVGQSGAELSIGDIITAGEITMRLQKI